MNELINHLCDLKALVVTEPVPLTQHFIDLLIAECTALQTIAEAKEKLFYTDAGLEGHIAETQMGSAYETLLNIRKLLEKLKATKCSESC